MNEEKRNAFATELNDMALTDVVERLSQLDEEVRNATDVAEVEERTELKAMLLERKAELEDLETRKQAAIEIEAGAETKTLETRKENNKMEQKTFGIETKEYRNAWLKNLQGKALEVEERAAITASGAIPTETLNKIVGKLELNPIINAVDVTYIAGNVSIPVEGTVNAANWVAMGTAATDSADTITTVNLAAYKLIKTVEMTADVQAMAIEAFEKWLVERLANKIECAVAAGIVAGTGSSQATGLNSVSASGNTWTKAGMTYTDLMAIIGALATQYANNATFVMTRAVFYGQVLGMVDTAKRPIVVADAQSPAKFNILGYPVIIDDNASGVIFGDLKEGYKFNFASPITVSSDNSVGFRAGSTVYRGMCLADGKPTGVGVVRFTQATA